MAVQGLEGGRGAHERWHITSTDIHPTSFPKLGRVISRDFGYAVAFHGFGREGILVGGAAANSLKREVTDAIGRAVAGCGIAMSIAQPGDELGGSIRATSSTGSPPAGQIEQGSAAREGHWQAIGDPVADVYGPKLA